MKSPNWLKLKSILFGNGDLNMEGWFDSLEKERRETAGGSTEEPSTRFFNGAGQEVDLETYLAEQAKIDRFRTHYTDIATRQGWDKDSGEGPVDFLVRKAYTTGYEDAITRDGRVLVNAQLLSEAADAIQVLAERQSDSEAGEWWTKHYGTIAGEFRRMLAKAHKSLR